MANEVKIKLTDAQKEKIREATGKDLPEIRVESFGSNSAASPTDHLVSAKVSAKKAMRSFNRRTAKVIMAKKASRISGKKTARHMAKKLALKKNARRNTRAAR